MNLIFDLDGTLIDSVPDIHAAVNRMLFGEGLAPLDLPTVTSFVGNGLPKLVERVMAARGIDRAQHQKLTQVVLHDYMTTGAALTRPYPGVPEALEALKAVGHRLAICTNKPEAAARMVLAELGLAHHFPVIVGGDTLPVSKPDPAPALETVRAMGGGAATFIGDSEVDAATAQAAGMPLYLFTEGYRKSPIEALPHHAAFSVFADLPGLIAKG